MKKILLIINILFIANTLQAQTPSVESIHFHLYTDSLKKGQHNYINVDAKLTNGRWKPLTSRDLVFTSSYSTIEGNELFIPEDFSSPSVTIKAALKSKPEMVIEKTIWIKTIPDPELPNKKGK